MPQQILDEEIAPFSLRQNISPKQPFDCSTNIQTEGFSIPLQWHDSLTHHMLHLALMIYPSGWIKTLFASWGTSVIHRCPCFLLEGSAIHGHWCAGPLCKLWQDWEHQLSGTKLQSCCGWKRWHKEKTRVRVVHGCSCRNVILCYLACSCMCEVCSKCKVAHYCGATLSADQWKKLKEARFGMPKNLKHRQKSAIQASIGFQPKRCLSHQGPECQRADWLSHRKACRSVEAKTPPVCGSLVMLITTGRKRCWVPSCRVYYVYLQRGRYWG